MTELELRMSFALSAGKWCGTKEGTAAHRQLLASYNRITPLPRGYRITENDPWCAAFASAVAWEAGFERIMPLECSCGRLLELAREMGIWVEADSHMPQIGDWVLYNWDAASSGDDEGAPDHVGIVVHIHGESFTVIEGNYENAVKLRTLRRDARVIRGFICPDFASIAEKEERMLRYRTIDEAPDYARETLQKLIKDGSLQGIAEGDLGLTEELIRVLVILDRRGKL